MKDFSKLDVAFIVPKFYCFDERIIESTPLGLVFLVEKIKDNNNRYNKCLDCDIEQEEHCPRDENGFFTCNKYEGKYLNHYRFIFKKILKK
jgi:hypothetical protein